MVSERRAFVHLQVLDTLETTSVALLR
jgi:hypothetical protein